MCLVQLVQKAGPRREHREMIQRRMGGVVMGLNVCHVDGEGDAGHLEELPSVVEEVGVVFQEGLPVTFEVGVVHLFYGI